MSTQGRQTTNYGTCQPTLIMWGQKDQIIPATYAQSLPDSVTVKVLPGCGHMVHMEAFSDVNRAMEQLWQ